MAALGALESIPRRLTAERRNVRYWAHQRSDDLITLLVARPQQADEGGVPLIFTEFQ